MATTPRNSNRSSSRDWRLRTAIIGLIVVLGGVLPLEVVALTQPTGGFTNNVDVNNYENFTLMNATGVPQTNQTYQSGETILINVTTTRVTNANKRTLNIKDWKGTNLAGTTITQWVQTKGSVPYSYEGKIDLPVAFAPDWYYIDLRITDTANRAFGATVDVILGNNVNVHSLITYKDPLYTTPIREFNASDTLYAEFYGATGITGGAISLLDFSRNQPLNNVNMGTGPVSTLTTNVLGDATRYRFSIDLNATPGLTLSFWYTLKLNTNGGAGIAFKGATEVHVLGNPSMTVESHDLAPATAKQGAASLPMMALNLTSLASGNNLVFTGVAVRKTGNSTLDSDVALVRLVEDLDGDMAYDQGTDPVLDVPRSFVGGDLAFGGFKKTINAGSTVHLLVLFTISPTATPKRTVGLDIFNDTWFSVDAPAGIVPILTPINSTLTEILSSPTNMWKVSGDGQTGITGTMLAPLVVNVTNSLGQNVDGVGVTWMVTAQPVGATGTALGNVTNWTDANGMAWVELMLGDLPGTYNVTASSVGLVGSPITFSATAIPPPPVLAKIVVSPATVTLDLGETQNFTADAQEADNSSIPGVGIAWALTPSGIGSITPSGVFTASMVGNATVWAWNGTVNGTATVTVVRRIKEILVTPDPISVAVGKTVNFTAVAKDRLGATINGTVFGWSVQNTTVASVDANGVAKGIMSGKTAVVAASGSVAGIANLTVYQTVVKIVVEPATASIEAGTTRQFNATAYDGLDNVFAGVVFAWVSGDTSIGNVTAAGLFTAKAPGNTTVWAINGSVNGTASVMVTPKPIPPRVLTKVIVSPAAANLKVGDRVAFKAVAYDQNGVPFDTATVTWTIDNATIGTLNATGGFVAKKTGQATVTASVTLGGVTKLGAAAVKVTAKSTTTGAGSSTIAIILLLLIVMVVAMILIWSRKPKDEMGAGKDGSDGGAAVEDDDAGAAAADDEDARNDKKGSKASGDDDAGGEDEDADSDSKSDADDTSKDDSKASDAGDDTKDESSDEEK